MFIEINLKRLLHSMNIIYSDKFKISNEKDRKKAQKNITEIMRLFHIHGAHHEYCRAIGNGMAHGSTPVKCKIYVGCHGQMVCVIEDSGEGFDYQDVIKKFKNNEVYYHNHGYGTRCYARNENLCVDWKKHGRQIILYYK